MFLRAFDGLLCPSEFPAHFFQQILNKNGKPSFDKLLHSSLGGVWKKRKKCVRVDRKRGGLVKQSDVCGMS